MEVLKGRVQSISKGKAIVIPNEHPETVTQPLVVPFYWQETMGNLQAGEECYYFEDNEHGGYIIGRTDGRWDNTLRGTLTVTEKITAQADIAASGDVTASGISLKSHTHTGNQGSPTSKPN